MYKIPKILVCGLINIDNYLITDKFPKNGETKKLIHSFKSLGGKAFNVAASSSLLGSNVNLLTIISNNKKEYIEKELNKYNLKYNNSIYTNKEQSNAYIILNNTGDNKILVNRNNLYEEWNNLKNYKIINNIDILLLETSFPIKKCILFAKYATNLKKKTIIDIGGENLNIENKLFKYIDIIVCNENEFKKLSNNYYSNFSINELKYLILNLIKKIKKIHNKNIDILIHLGKNGSIFYENEKFYITKAIKVDVVDTTGAGDCFLGSFCSYYYSNRKMSLQLSNVAAGLSIQKMGTVQSYPNSKLINNYFTNKSNNYQYL